MRATILPLLLLTIASPGLGLASSMLPVSTADQFAMADGVFRGTVVSVRSEQSPATATVHTVAAVRVDESLKGTLPPVVALTHPGGEIGGITQDNGLWPQLKPNDHRLFFVQRQQDGTLAAQLGQVSAVPLNRSAGPTSDVGAAANSWLDDLLTEVRTLSAASGGAGADLRNHAAPVVAAMDGTVQAQSGSSGVTNMLTDGQGIASRFLSSDRGRPVHYLVDGQFLPEGVSLEAALTAVSNAFHAWAEVSLLSFQFDGVENFGRPVTTSVEDGRIYIQLHDAYGLIPSTNTLGIGGRSYISALLTNANWGTGGRVGNHEFHQSTYGYVAINHSVPAVRDLSTLEEVLCHELGHALGLAHSSENPAQPTASEDYQAIMYFRAHRDGRGATLNGLDQRVIAQPYPELNAPPFCHDRMLDIVTTPAAPAAVPGVNQLELRGYDRESEGTIPVLTNATRINGRFSLTANELSYVPAGYFNAGRLDPAAPDNSAYDRAYYRVEEGGNASPYKQVRVLSFMPDSQPRNPWTQETETDGLPDEWMVTHFGDPNPAAGPNRKANDDFDHDSLSNLDEFRAGMIPTDADSAQRVRWTADGHLEFQAKPFELYEIQASSDFKTWFLWGNPVVPVTSVGRILGVPDTHSSLALRVFKVP